MSQSRVLVIEARYYDHLADMLLAGAVAELEKAGVAWDKLTIPGVLELPATLAMVLEAQERLTIDARYDGYVVLGTAIRGESEHFHHVCTECMRGCNDLAIKHRLALGSAVLAVHNEAQALHRADPTRKDIGGQAGRACLRMMETKRALKLL